MQRELDPIRDEYLDQLHYPLSLNVYQILLLCVDDPSLMGEEKPIVDCKRKLPATFEMQDLSEMHYFLGLEVWQNPGEIILSQAK